MIYLTPNTVKFDRKPSSSSRLNCSTSSKQCGGACIPRSNTCRIEGSNTKSSPLRKAGNATKAVANYAGPDIAATLIVGAAGFGLRKGLSGRRKSYQYRQASKVAKRTVNRVRYGKPGSSRRRPRRDSVYATGFQVDQSQLAV